MGLGGFSSSFFTTVPSSDSSADAELLRVGHLGEEDLGVGRAVAEFVHQALDAAGDQVVAEVHDERIVLQEVLGDLHRVGETEGRLLLDVGAAGAELRTVADRLADLVLGIADDDADFGDAGGDDGLDAEEEDRLVGHRYELLGGRVGEGAQARALAAGKDQAFHGWGLQSDGRNLPCRTR